jgi:norsolorinic acid ketoreductase
MLTAFCSVMQTDMGNAGARHFGLEEAPIPLARASAFILKQIQEATREENSGKFLTIDDSRSNLLW